MAHIAELLMHTIIQYQFPHETFTRKLSFKTYALALEQIEYFKTIGIKSSLYSIG